jgi:hypothetical protein
VSRRSEVLPYSGEQSGGGDRCEGDKERRNQVIDHNTNDSTAGSSTDDVFAVAPGAVDHHAVYAWSSWVHAERVVISPASSCRRGHRRARVAS